MRKFVDGYEVIELHGKDRYIVDTWRGGYRVIVQRWDGSASVIGDYLTKKEAEGIKKLMEE